MNRDPGPSLTFEDEFVRILAPVSLRKRAAVEARNGFGGADPVPLRELASRFGVSTQRASQLSNAFLGAWFQHPDTTPVLERTLEYVRSRLPASATDIEQAGV